MKGKLRNTLIVMSLVTAFIGGATLSRYLERDSVVSREESKKTESLDGMLSNGMEIPKYIVRRIDNFDKGKIVVVDVGYGEEYDLKIYDEEDGKPYYFSKLDVNKIEKNFILTYKFCDKHDPIPIWFPTEFRSDPCYGLGLIRSNKNKSDE